MKNLSKPLATGYYDLLNGMVVDGKVVTLHYLKVPNPVREPYILITGMFTTASNDTRDDFGYDTTVDLRIITSFAGDYGSMNLADEIAEEILARLIPEPGVTPVTAVGFNVAGVKLRGMRDYDDSIGTKSIFEKRITIEHLIYQL